MKRSCSCSMPGVWRAVAHNEGAVVIYHSPKACGHVTREMDLGGHYHALARGTFVPRQYTAPLVTSNLRDEHSIFGGADQLRQCIEYVVERYKPLYIMIANSCVAGVIGDDTPAIAREAETDFGIPVMTVPCNGFLDGEYHAGFYHTAKVLAERFMQWQPARADTVTLLGDRGGPNGADAKEMTALLSSFGLQVQGRFPGYATLEEMKRVPVSALCIPLGGGPQSYAWIRKLAVDLEERFGIPFLDHDLPVGWGGTKAWIKQLGKMLGREQAALQVEAAQEQRLKLTAVKCRSALQGARVVLGIGRPLSHFQPGWVLELLALAGVTPAKILLFKGLTGEQKTALRQELAKHTITPIVDETEDEVLLHTSDVVVTTHELEDDALRQFYLPVLPPLGVGGMIELWNKLGQLAKRPGGQGGVQYGW
ncbi:nitrogenase component 1 [Sporomusa ovata]